MLEGKVGEFSLPEIFQLIALTKKSGVLVVGNDARKGRVRFRDGEVCEAAADAKRLALGARLVAAGLVDEGQLVAALEAKRDRGGEVLGLLLEHAAIDEGALHAFVREQIADAVVDLLRMEDATFRFDAEDASADPLIDVKVATEQLVTEGNQRLAEWDTIRRQVPSRDSVLAVSPRIPGGEGDVRLDSESWQLLALVDGRRRVRDIVDLCGRSEFSTSKVLAGLVSRGLVEVCAEGEDGPLSPLQARREVLSRLEELELSELQPDPPEPAPVTERNAEPASEQRSEEPVRGAAPEASGLDVPPVPAVPAALATPVPEPQPVPVPEATQAEAGAGAEPRGEGWPASRIDRAQVARELASLGIGGDLDAAAPAEAAAGATSENSNNGSGRESVGDEDAAERRLVRDEELDKGLLLRLIDGVKGA